VTALTVGRALRRFATVFGTIGLMRTRTPALRHAPLLLIAAALLVVAGCGRSAPEGEAALDSATDPAAQATSPESVDSTDADPAMADGSDSMNDGDAMNDGEAMADTSADTQPPAVAPPIITSAGNTAIVDQTPDLAGVRITSENPIVAPVPVPSTTSSTQPDAMANPGVHVVQPGDSLSVIAEQYQVPVQAIVEANGIEDVNAIMPGEELIIPAG